MNSNEAYNSMNVNMEFNLAENMERIENEMNNSDAFNEKDTTKQNVIDNSDSKFLTDKKIIQSIERTQKTTIPFLTKYEEARIIGVRMQQLASGAKPCVDVTGLKSIEEIAYAELKQRALPFIVKRPLPNGTVEYWKLEEFTIV